MVGTNFKPSFDMFRTLTKEAILSAPSVPVERLKKECEPLNEALKARRKRILAEKKN